MYLNKNRVKFYVDEEKRVVVAVLQGAENDFRDAARKIFRQNAMDDMTFYGANSYLSSDVFRGKSRCHPDDEWDVEAGKTLAFIRLLDKYARAWNKEVEYLIDRLSNVAVELDGLFSENYSG